MNVRGDVSKSAPEIGNSERVRISGQLFRTGSSFAD